MTSKDDHRKQKRCCGKFMLVGFLGTNGLLSIAVEALNMFVRCWTLVFALCRGKGPPIPAE